MVVVVVVVVGLGGLLMVVLVVVAAVVPVVELGFTKPGFVELVFVGLLAGFVLVVVGLTVVILDGVCNEISDNWNLSLFHFFFLNIFIKKGITKD